MKKSLLTLLSIISLFSCNNNKQILDTFYGKKIDGNNLITYSELLNKVDFNGTLEAKIEGEIIETCPKKGCWMNIKLNDDTMMVRFKDYAFFVPKEGVEGKHVIVNGEAFYDTLSVDLLRHYAEDAGKSVDEINSITEPEYVLSFTANGVIIKE